MRGEWNGHQRVADLAAARISVLSAKRAELELAAAPGLAAALLEIDEGTAEAKPELAAAKRAAEILVKPITAAQGVMDDAADLTAAERLAQAEERWPSA